MLLQWDRACAPQGVLCHELLAVACCSWGLVHGAHAAAVNCCWVHLQGACDRGVAIDVLQKKQNVLNHLVETVCNLVSQLRQKIAAGTQAAACESSSSGGAATDAATIQAEALAELGQGSWTYTEILREYILTLKLLASFEIEYFPEDLAGQLWDALMNAPTKDHMTAALVRFFGGLSAGAECSRLARSVSDWQTVVSGAGKAVRERKGASRLCLCVCVGAFVAWQRSGMGCSLSTYLGNCGFHACVGCYSIYPARCRCLWAVVGQAAFKRLAGSTLMKLAHAPNPVFWLARVAGLCRPFSGEATLRLRTAPLTLMTRLSGSCWSNTWCSRTCRRCPWQPPSLRGTFSLS